MALPKKCRYKIEVDREKYFFCDSIARRGISPISQVLLVVSEEENNQLLYLEFPHLQNYKFKTGNGDIDIQRYSDFAPVPRSFVRYVIQYFVDRKIWSPKAKGKRVCAHLEIKKGISNFKIGRIPETYWTKNLTKNFEQNFYQLNLSKP